MPSYMNIVDLALAASNVSTALAVPVHSSREVQEQSLSRHEVPPPESGRPPEPGNPPAKPGDHVERGLIPESWMPQKKRRLPLGTTFKFVALTAASMVGLSIFNAITGGGSRNAPATSSTSSANQNGQPPQYWSGPYYQNGPPPQYGPGPYYQNGPSPQYGPGPYYQNGSPSQYGPGPYYQNGQPPQHGSGPYYQNGQPPQSSYQRRAVDDGKRADFFEAKARSISDNNRRATSHLSRDDLGEELKLSRRVLDELD